MEYCVFMPKTSHSWSVFHTELNWILCNWITFFLCIKPKLRHLSYTWELHTHESGTSLRVLQMNPRRKKNNSFRPSDAVDEARTPLGDSDGCSGNTGAGGMESKRPAPPSSVCRPVPGQSRGQMRGRSHQISLSLSRDTTESDQTADHM